MKTVTAIARSLANLLYPLHCAICKKALNSLEDMHVCELCLGLIKHNPKPHCRSCGRAVQDAWPVCAECRRTKFPFHSASSAGLYEGVLKELVSLFKYKGRVSLGGELAKIMIGYLKDNGELLDGLDALTYVPLQNKRLRERGFNQSKVLAINISKEFGIPLYDILEKIRSTKPQNELARDERLGNLKGAFKARSGIDIKGFNLLLIDDVMTTGATLSECSKTLLEAGAGHVRCLTLARGI